MASHKRKSKNTTGNRHTRIPAGTAGTSRAADRIPGDAGHCAPDALEALRTCADALIRIERNGERMNEIAGVFGRIADRTILLALNAAIAASRAGERGLGLAAQADEARRLAERGRIAAGELTDFINENAHYSRDGVERCALMGNALKKLGEGESGAAGGIVGTGRATRKRSKTTGDV